MKKRSVIRLLKFSVFAVLCLITLFFMSCNNSKDSVIPEEIKEEKYLDMIEKAEKYLLENNFHGTVLVGKKNQILYAEGFGLSDSKNSSSPKNNAATVYEIGSITKQMTAAAIMQLVEDKKLTVDDKLSKYFPDYEHGNKITVKMLLNMRSGLTDFINAGDEFFPRKVYNQIERAQIANKPLDENIVLKYFNDAPLLASPDSTYFYCNTNYYLLACIIEQVTNQTYQDYIQQNIFTPCKMISSNLEFQATTGKGYDYRGRYYSIPKALSKGCGDINSNVIDLFKWNSAFFNGKVVSKKSLHQMTNSKSYGYGVYCNQNFYFHGGNTNGFNSYNAYYPKEKLSVIVLVNEPLSHTSATTVARNLYKIFKNSNK